MIRLTTDETRTSFDGIRNQIKDLEASIMAVYKNGSSPLGVSIEIGIAVTNAVETLKQAREQIEKLVCYFDG